MTCEPITPRRKRPLSARLTRGLVAARNAVAGRRVTALAWMLCLSAAILILAVQGRAQQRPASAASKDPRVGLKAGLRDAGQAARNMELVSSVPKPQGFFDPKAQAGTPTQP